MKAGYEETVGEKHVTKTSKKQVIKGKGDVTVYQPVVNIFAVVADEKLLAHLPELYGGDAGLVRKDLLLPEHAILSPRKEARKVIREFRGFIPDEDYRAMIAAEAIANLEDRGMREEANALRGNLKKKFGERGSRIYNRYRSGDVQDFFLFKLRWTLYECQGRVRDAARLFGKFWNDELEFFERAVWTNDMMSAKEIVDEVKVRLDRRGVRRVLVYARGPSNVEKVRNAIDSWLASQDQPRFRKLEESYTIAQAPCVCWHIEPIA